MDREVEATPVGHLRRPTPPSWLLASIAHGAAAIVMAAMVWAAAQPVMTDDAWWHLAMGETYAREGPWLVADPLLHTASEAPAPASWLADIGLHAASRIAGIQGLRVVHALLVVAILASAWSLLRRTSRSAIFASLGTALFVNLAAYRLVQLRPHLLTMLATLLLVHLVIAPSSPQRRKASSLRNEVPSWRGAVLVVALFAVWANVHAAFVLGPILLAAGLAGLVAADVAAAGGRLRGSPRAGWIAALWVVASAATLLNPEGPDQLMYYFVAGGDTPALEVVHDEWTPLDLLAFPPPNLPPSTLGWAIAGGLVLVTPLVVAAIAWSRRPGRSGEAAPNMGETLDPMLATMALASLFAMCAAVRFLWLGVIPLALIGQVLSVRSNVDVRRRARARWLAAGALVLLLPASFRLGDWPMISRGAIPSLYSRPFAAMKYHAHAVWLLSDAGIEGRLFNSYFMGNFLGYWLAPGLRTFMNGSLNLPPQTLRDGRALMARTGGQSGQDFVELLDRHSIDVFFGEGMPVVPRLNRPTDFTAAHLDATPGWIPIFRNVHSSLHLRDVPRNRVNLLRIADYYRRQDVPFDPRRGFVVADVVQRAPEWALAHAVIPSRFPTLQRTASSSDPFARRAARDDLAALYLLIGEYERAASVLSKRLHSDPTDSRTGRRLVWALLHAGRFEEAREAAREWVALDASLDPLTAHIVQVALDSESLPDAETRARVATLPVLPRAELTRVYYGFQEPEARRLRVDR